MMMMMTLAPVGFQPMALHQTVQPKSGHVFRPVAQSPIGTLQPLDLEGEDLTSFFYPNMPLSQAPITTSYDANLHMVILTGEDALKSMVADKLQSQASGGKANTPQAFLKADVNEALSYSKNAKLLDLTPVLDEPVAFTAETQTFMPPPERAKATIRQAALLKQQDEQLKQAKEQGDQFDDLATHQPIKAEAILSMSQARALVAEEQKALPPCKTLLPKLEADYWKTLLLASAPTVKASPTLQLQTFHFSSVPFSANPLGDF